MTRASLVATITAAVPPPRAPRDSSTSVMRSAAKGGETAFRKLLDRYTVRLVLFIRRIGGKAIRGDADEEDIFQEVSALAWAKLSGFKSQGSGSFYRWLTALAKNVVRNRIRYLDARPDLKSRQLPDGSSSNRTPGPAASSASPSSVAAHRQDIERVDRAIMDLPRSLRRIIEAHLFEEKSLSEIALEVGLKKTTVWERLQEAMVLLKRSLGRLHSTIS